MKKYTNITTSIYEDDLKHVGGGNPNVRRYFSTDFNGEIRKIPLNPGKRPPRKRGESPLS